MPRFEHPEYVLSWFREIRVEGRETHVLVPPHQPVRKRSRSEEHAQREALDRIAKWKAQGFQEVGPETQLQPAPQSAAKDEPVKPATLVLKKGRETFQVRLDDTRVEMEPPAKVEEFDTPAEAKARYDALIVEHYNQGYELQRIVEDDGADGRDDADAKPRAQDAMRNTAPEPVDEAQLEGLRDASERDAWLVYADWLQGQDAPRGRLITLDCMLEDKPSAEIASERLAILREHDTLYPRGLIETVESDGIPRASRRLAAVWRRGFLDEVRIAGGEDLGLDAPALLREVLTHPSSALLRALEFGACSYEGNYAWVTQALREHPAPALRSLALARSTYSDYELSWSSLGDLSALWPCVPRVENVFLRGGTLTLGDMGSLALRSLTIETTGLALENAESLMSGRPWPHLTHLHLWLGVHWRDGLASIEPLRPLLEADGFPALKHLGLMNSELTNDLVAELARAPILEQLETLDLSLGVMTDTGAQPLLDASDRFAHLREIRLDENFLSDDIIEALSRLEPMVTAANQKPPVDEEDRYVTVSE